MRRLKEEKMEKENQLISQGKERNTLGSKPDESAISYQVSLQ